MNPSSLDLRRRALLAGGLAAGLTAAARSQAASTTPSRSNNAPVRTIGLEEHCLPNELFDDWDAPPRLGAGPGSMADVGRRLQDFDGQRLEDMDRAGIEMALLSLTVAGPQGQPDPKRAQDIARRGNDAMAQEISKHPDRFAGLGCLSMHDVDAACREFERVVKTLGFRGVLLNNWQRAGAHGDIALTYDDARYDPFWDMAQRLEAPVYLHPGWSPPWYAKGVAGLTRMLDAAGWNWAVETGSHALRIITSGVFDRFPKAQMILGHNGEHIVTDLWRIEDRLHGGWSRLKGGLPASGGDGARPYSVMKVTAGDYRAEKTVSAYFRTNVSVTTSGQFNDAGLQHILKEIGADRVMFSTDYPYEDMVEGGDWFRATPLGDDERYAIARGNQIKLFKLPLRA